MEATVKRLREQGRRKPFDTVNAETGTHGRLALASAAAGTELRLDHRDPRHPEPLLPVLHEVRLVTLHGNTLLFRGTEHGPGGVEYVQEWSVRVRLATYQGELFAAEKDAP